MKFIVLLKDMLLRITQNPIVCILIFFHVASCESEVEERQVVSYYESFFFRDVQLSEIFEDSKTFVDCRPKFPLHIIIQNYELLKKNKQASNGISTETLRSFVLKHYSLPVSTITYAYQSDTSRSMKAHILELWPVLSRKADVPQLYSSLLALPKPYIVPGGRFREVYYWDSYFTLEGLLVSGEDSMAKHMCDNFAFLIDSIGFIPNGNRDYYLGRSQPPVFSLMVDRLASGDRTALLKYLPQLEKEYAYWMSGSERLNEKVPAFRRVVQMPDGSLLNRYWDDLNGPRPESYREDFRTVQANHLDARHTYKDLRAGAESGWDYSSRWFRDRRNISTIHTTDIIPIDLNCLLFALEQQLAKSYKMSGNNQQAQTYTQKSTARKQAIQTYLWDEQQQFFIDYDHSTQKPTGVLSLAGAFPLFLRLASMDQAQAIQERLMSQFLKAGGFVTTLEKTGQQWDYPNGWAPMQWIVVKGLYQYGYEIEGKEGAMRWLRRNAEVFKSTGKMMEKYNVVDTTLQAGGGEYPLQDGFGWTNGVALGLQGLLEDEK